MLKTFIIKPHFIEVTKKLWGILFQLLKNLISVILEKGLKIIYGFSTLYTTIPHHLLNKTLPKIIYILFLNRKFAVKLDFQQLLWDFHRPRQNYLIVAIMFLIKNCYFTCRNTVFKQDIGIPMGIWVLTMLLSWKICFFIF